MTHSRGFFSCGLVLASPSLLALPRRAGARGCGGEGLRGFSGARSAPPCPRGSAALQRPPPRPAPGRAAGPSRRRGIPLGAGPGERTQASRGILASLAAAFPVFPPAAPAVGDLTAPQMGSPLPLEAQARTKPRPRVLMFYVAAAPLPSQTLGWALASRAGPLLGLRQWVPQQAAWSYSLTENTLIVDLSSFVKLFGLGNRLKHKDGGCGPCCHISLDPLGVQVSKMKKKRAS